MGVSRSMGRPRDNSCTPSVVVWEIIELCASVCPVAERQHCIIKGSASMASFSPAHQALCNGGAVLVMTGSHVDDFLRSTISLDILDMHGW